MSGSVITESPQETQQLGFSSATLHAGTKLRQRRRHSSYHPHSWKSDDTIQQLVDSFLAELGRRLDFLESFDNVELDINLDNAYLTLCAVREACSHISDGVWDAGRRRARILVNTLEERYNDALITKETLEQKAQQAVMLMEYILVDLEKRSHAILDTPFGTMAHSFINSGRRRMDGSIEKAKEVVDGGFEKARKARDQLRESIEHAVQTAREHGLICYNDLPEAWRVNPYIIRGYRFHSAKLDCVRSVLSISNETFNIWSHAIGFIIVLAVAFYFYPTSANFSRYTKADVFVAAVFFFAACKCLLCSTIWHTMNSIAEKNLMEKFACVDYLGISFLVAASIMTTEYTAFYCEPVSRWIYMVATAVLGTAGAILPLHPTFNRADMAWKRVGFYVALTSTGFLPLFQLILTRGFWWATYFYGPLLKSLMVYLAGAFVYATKTPERWAGGGFDYLGGSHNLWHIAVLGGIILHCNAMHHFFAEAFSRAQHGCSA